MFNKNYVDRELMTDILSKMNTDFNESNYHEDDKRFGKAEGKVFCRADEDKRNY
jgi:hypothetical protein